MSRVDWIKKDRPKIWASGRRMAGYTIAVVSRLTGLLPDTIRKWESRYGAVVPARDRNGLRRFSEAHVHRLRRLRAATELGYPIRDAAALESNALERIVTGDRPAASPALSRKRPRRSDSIVRAVLLGLRDLDAEQIDRMLTAAAHLMTPQAFVFEVVSPLFEEIGVAWRRGDVSIAREHLFSAITRSILGNLLRRYSAGAGAPAALFTTLPGDPHEFGVLLAAMLAASQGWQAHYLGPSIPVAAIARAAHEFKVDVVVLGAVRTRRGNDVVRMTEQLASALDDAVEVWFGGKAPARLTAGRHGSRISTVPTLQEFFRRVRPA